MGEGDAGPRPLRVLMSAYSCVPNRGSEPYVGWNWAQQAAVNHEVWVLTASFGRAEIEAWQRGHPNPRLHFVYHDPPRWLLWAMVRFGGLRGHYIVWQLTAPVSARRLQRAHEFDVVHHVTFNAVDVPGWLPLLGVPFVWGPVGGAQLPPPQLREYFGRRWGRERLRRLRKWLAMANLWNHYVARHASVVMAANADTEAFLRSIGAKNVRRELETAVAVPDAEPNRRARDSSEALTLAWAGGLIPRKAPGLAIDVVEALRARGVAARLRIAGTGELEDELRRRARDAGVAECVEFLGALPHDAMPGFYAAADVFLFTSLQDTSGNVVLEAMAHGLPVVALDHHGVPEMVCDDCGVRVLVGDRASVIAGFADALQRFAANPTLSARAGIAAREHVRRRHGWERKRELIDELYAVAASRTRRANRVNS